MGLISRPVMLPHRFAASSFPYPSAPPLREKIASLFFRRRASEKVRRQHSEAEALAKELQRHLQAVLSAGARDETAMRQAVDELRALGHKLVIDDETDDCTVFCDLPERNLALWFWWDGQNSSRRISRIEVLWQKM